MQGLDRLWRSSPAETLPESALGEPAPSTHSMPLSAPLGPRRLINDLPPPAASPIIINVPGFATRGLRHADVLGCSAPILRSRQPPRFPARRRHRPGWAVAR